MHPRFLLLSAACLALAGCGGLEMLNADKAKARGPAAASDQVPANTIAGSVEVDGAGSNVNVRVELYEVTGRDPVDAVRRGDPLVVARTARDGRYSFNLGSQARAPAGQAKTWLVRAGGEAADNPKGPEATITFASAAARGRLPPLYLWDGAPKVETGDERITFRLAPLPGAKRVEPPVYGVEMVSAGGGTPLLPPPGGAPEVSVPRLALQEMTWTYRPLAALDQAQADGTIYHAAYRGAVRQVQGGNPPPLTRQRDAKLVPPGLGFRALTDGKLDNMLPHAMPPDGRVEIDLGSTTEVGQIYLLGLEVAGSDQVAVHLSDNPGQIGPPLAQAAARDALEIRLPQGARGRYLAVRFAGQLTALGEIVAYPPLSARQWEAAKPVAPFSNQVYSAPVN
jgi:hypothetical protein